MHPAFSAGFRVFFLAASTWAALALALWLSVLAGSADLPSRFDPLTWHIHEMLFGFVMAAVGGFLLTAIPNWTNRAPVSGVPLIVLAALWLLGRIVCCVSALLPGWFVIITDMSFPVVLEITAARELFAVGNRRNYPLLVPVIVLGIGNLLMHLQALNVDVGTGLGWRLGIACVAVLISVIGGRIVPAFTRNWLVVRSIESIPPSASIVDHLAIGGLAIGMLVWSFLPDWRGIGVILPVVAAVHLARMWRWRGMATYTEPLLLILHIGYLWLVVGVALLGVSILIDAVPPAAAIHALTAGAMATMILAVMTRATLGHTGHTLHADATTVTIYALINVAALLRIAAAWMVDAQADFLEVSALAWIGAFTLFVVHYGPMLLAPRG